MKKLILITAMLMATSVWSEVAYFNCEGIKGEIKHLVSFGIDTEKGIVLITDKETEYMESGNEISWKIVIGTSSFNFYLDRVSGKLLRTFWSFPDVGRPYQVESDVNYKCTLTTPLF